MNPTYPSTTSSTDTATSNVTGSLGESMQSTAQNTYSEGRSAIKRTGEALRNELINLKSDLDELLSRATNMSDIDLSREHARLMGKFSSVKSAAKGMADQANRQFNEGVEMTTDYVKQKPLQSVAVATGVGLVLGMLFRGR